MLASATHSLGNMPNRPLKFRELLKKLSEYGVFVLKKRGKGSERILLKPIEQGSKKGPQYPIKHHGDSTEITLPVILTILRRFDIDEDSFWN